MRFLSLLLIAFLVLIRPAPAEVTWEFFYVDPEGVGFRDPVLGPERRRVLEDVAAYVSSLLDHNGTIPLRVWVVQYGDGDCRGHPVRGTEFSGNQRRAV